MQKTNVKEEMLKLENKLLEKIQLGVRESVAMSSNIIMIFLGIITIVFALGGLFLGNSINKKYKEMEILDKKMADIYKKYEDAKIIEKIADLEMNINNIALIGTGDPNGMVLPDFVGQFYIRKYQANNFLYIAAKKTKDGWGNVMVGGNKLNIQNGIGFDR